MSSVTTRHEEVGPLTVTASAKKIFQALYLEQKPPEEDDSVARLQVSDLISKMSFYYEKIRNAVHYSEEHLLRKDAIFRILKRQLVIEGTVRLVRSEDSRTIAQHLLIELIRAGYLPNKKLPETKVEDVASIINKYTSLRALAFQEAASHVNFFTGGHHGKSFDGRSDITNWLMGLAAADIEEHIGYNQATRTIVLGMYQMLEQRIELPDTLPYDRDLQIQIYLAIYRNFLKFDNDMLALILLRYFNADWETISPAGLKKIAAQLVSLKRAIDAQLDHPLVGQLNRIARIHTVYFKILEDVVTENPIEIYDMLQEDPALFTRKVRLACQRRYNKARNTLWRSAWRSIIYILLTKSVFVVLLEVPATQFFGEEVNILALLLNVTMPAVLIFLSVISMRLPSEANTQQIVEGIDEILYKEKKRASIKLRKPRARKPITNIIFALIYMVTFFVSFGAIVWLLEGIHFSWVSVIIFLFFLTFASFFVIRIRRTAKEWLVIDARENIIGFLIDFFSVPIVATGKWLSGKFARLNVFAFILDFIIEAPFKIFVEIAEQWTRYVRERKEEL